jgi:hypothetical protein
MSISERIAVRKAAVPEALVAGHHRHGNRSTRSQRGKLGMDRGPAARSSRKLGRIADVEAFGLIEHDRGLALKKGLDPHLLEAGTGDFGYRDVIGPEIVGHRCISKGLAAPTKHGQGIPELRSRREFRSMQPVWIVKLRLLPIP